jgi:hypothetical protein
MTAGRALLIILALAAIVFVFVAISDKWKPAGVDRVPPLPPGGLQGSLLPGQVRPGATAPK